MSEGDEFVLKREGGMTDAEIFGPEAAERMKRLDLSHEWADGHEERSYDWDELQPKLAKIGEHKSFAFEITRTRQDGLSFSAEAVEGLARGVMSFFLARCHHEYTEHGTMATKARVVILVDLE